jgi:hypothetical protein
LAVDSDVVVAEALTDEELVEAVMPSQPESDGDDDTNDDVEMNEPPPPSTKETLEALSVVRRFIDSDKCTPTMYKESLKHIHALVKNVEYSTSLRQKTLDDFFPVKPI